MKNANCVEIAGNKGMKNTPYRKIFKTSEAALAWAEKVGASIDAWRDLGPNGE